MTSTEHTTTVGPRPWLDRLERRPAAALVGGALAAGVVWGALARGWMRVISTEPEFTSSGSLFIVGAFAVAATTQAVALVARRWRSAALRGAGRVVGLVGMLPLFVGAGVTMLPTVVGGGLAFGQRGWPRLVRALAVAVAVAPVVAITLALVDDLGFGPRLVAGVVGMVVIYAGVVIAVTASLGRAVDARPLPRTLRVAVLVAATVLLLLATVGIAGLRG
jgi:hypothetical protein